MKISVILTTYNRPEALMAVFEGYRAQTDQDFEIIVADDGSTIETKFLINDFKKRSTVGLKHVWQEDKGFRAAAIRNLALARSDADYIIFSDGDCIPLPSFIEKHRALSERSWFLSGNRILLSETFTNKILTDKICINTWTKAQWFRAFLRRDINRFKPFLFLPKFAPLRKTLAKRYHGVMTCNLSAWRDDLIKINGLDESYLGWGLEDSDLVIRLLRSGVRHKSARFAAPVLHLWHKGYDMTKFGENKKRLDELMGSNRTQAICGVSQYL
jgi:glycosyltransferase involved in cell wall biosynthesis